MSYEWLKRAATYEYVPDTHAYALLCALASYCNKDGECFPKIKTLAQQTKQTTKSVRNKMRLLKDAGLVESALVQGRKGYRLILSEKRNDVPYKGNNVPQKHDAFSEQHSQRTVSASQNTELHSHHIEVTNEVTLYEESCVPLDIWNSYLLYRKEIKKPMTEYAQKLALEKLKRWEEEGHDPIEIINTAIMNGWSGLFKPKGNKNDALTKTPNDFEGFGRAAAKIYQA